MQSPPANLTPEQIAEARERKLKQLRENAVQLGGKGTARRKKRITHKPAGGNDEKKLQTVLKRMGLSTIPAVEEVVMIGKAVTDKDGKETSTPARYFTRPKVQALPAANTYVITGPSEEKEYTPELAYSPEVLKQLMKRLQLATRKEGDDKEKADEGADGEKTVEIQDDDDDIPELVETNFESVAQQAAATEAK